MSNTRTRSKSEDADNLGGQTLLERFERYSRLADSIAAAGIVWLAFASVTHWKNYIPPTEQQLSVVAWLLAAIRFFEDAGWAPVLAITAIAAHLAGRIFARKNIGHLRSMFADANTPTGFQIVGRWELFLMINFQLAMALTMIFTSRWVILPCVCWIVLHAMYLYSNHRQRAETGRVFADRRYEPDEHHPHRKFILKRRAAVERYLARPHDAREYFVICSASVAIGFFVLEQSHGLAFGNVLAYVTMISGALVNEVIVGLWRHRFESEVDAANVAQLIHDRSRGL